MVAEVTQVFFLYWTVLTILGVWLYRMDTDLEKKIKERRRKD